MKLITVGTGSKGNCYLIENNDHYLALDAGCKWKDVQIACGFKTSNIDSCLITHEHGDHCKYIKEFTKCGITVYASDPVAKRLTESGGGHIRSVKVKHQTRIIGGCIIIPFDVPHEATSNSAYLIDFPNGERILYVTDFEYIPLKLSRWRINHFLIAVNHSDDIPDDDRAREHRIRGHSSLEVVKDFLQASMSDKCQNVIACHLSGEYANESKIIRELRGICGDSVKVSIAHKGETINL